MDPFDELELRLRAATRERHAGRRVRSRWLRGLTAAAAAALLLSGGALAATRLVSGSAPGDDAREVAARAVAAARSLPACRRYEATSSPVLSDTAPLPAITSTLPGLARSAPASQRARAIALVPRGGVGGPLLRRTVRVLPAAGGASLLVYVELGIGGGAPIDPGACGAVRRAEATKLAGDRPAVLTGALHRLDAMKDTVVDLQTLRVFVRLRGHGAMPGGGVPVRPGGRLAAGVVASGSAGKGQRVLGVIAGPRTTFVKAPGVARRIPVTDGLYVLRLARGRTVAVRELDAQGRVLRTRRVA